MSASLISNPVLQDEEAFSLEQKQLSATGVLLSYVSFDRFADVRIELKKLDKPNY